METTLTAHETAQDAEDELPVSRSAVEVCKSRAEHRLESCKPPVVLSPAAKINTLEWVLGN